MDEPLSQALGAVRSFVAGREPLGETLDQVAIFAVKALRADMAGLTLLYPDGKARTAAFTDDAAVEVDDAQYKSDRGPCLEAFRTKMLISVTDTAADDRWPEFAEAAVAHDVRSSLSAPLVIAGEGIGALNLYSARIGHFMEDFEDDAQLFAAEAAVALANAQAYWEQASLAAGLRDAMTSRATIEQAKGVIMATAGVGPDEAFDLLRQQSQHENRKLRDLAADLVARQDRRQSGPQPD
jgi:GAF domain-containing protein